jgi:hypothetical protein
MKTRGYRHRPENVESNESCYEYTARIAGYSYVTVGPIGKV